MVRIIPPKMCSLCNSISSHAFTASYKVSCKVSQMFWFFIKCVLKWNIWDTSYKTLYNVDFLKNSSSSRLDSLFVLLNQLQFQRWLWLLLLYLLPLIVNYCSKGVSFSNRHVCTIYHGYSMSFDNLKIALRKWVFPWWSTFFRVFLCVITPSAIGIFY